MILPDVIILGQSCIRHISWQKLQVVLTLDDSRISKASFFILAPILIYISVAIRKACVVAPSKFGPLLRITRMTLLYKVPGIRLNLGSRLNR